MVPAVRVRAAHDVVQRAIAQADVAVLEEAVGGVGDVVEREDPRVHGHQQERQAVEAHLQRLFERMEARGVEPIELFHRVMHGVQFPERVVLVGGAVHPVAQEIHDEHHQHRLGPERPAVRPQRRDWEIETACRLDEKRDEEEPDERRDRQLHHGHERQVGAHFPVRRTPVEPVGPEAFARP